MVPVRCVPRFHDALPRTTPIWLFVLHVYVPLPLPACTVRCSRSVSAFYYWAEHLDYYTRTFYHHYTHNLNRYPCNRLPDYLPFLYGWPGFAAVGSAVAFGHRARLGFR